MDLDVLRTNPKNHLIRGGPPGEVRQLLGQLVLKLSGVESS